MRGELRVGFDGRLIGLEGWFGVGARFNHF